MKTKLGYFTRGDLEHVRAILEELEIEYTEGVDVEAGQGLFEARQEENRHRPATNMPDNPIHLCVYYFEIEEEDFPRIGNRLENYAIFTTPKEALDISQIESVQDYFCPSCSHYSERRGLCPKHGVPLIPSDEHKLRKVALEEAGRRRLWQGLVVAFVVCAVAIYYFSG